MTGFLVAAVAALAVLVTLIFGAVVELHRQLLQLRQQAGFVDDVQRLEFNAAVRLDSFIQTVQSADTPQSRFAMVILSTTCSTCVTIAERLAERRAAGILMVVASGDESTAAEWLDLRGLGWSEWIIFDFGGKISDKLGIELTPAAIRFENGYATIAHTLPSARQFDLVAKWVRERPRSDIVDSQ